MGIGGISIWQLLIILAIVIVLFGTKKLRNMGGDLGSAIKNFRSAMKDGEAEEDKNAAKDKEEAKPQLSEANKNSQVIEGQVTGKETSHKQA